MRRRTLIVPLALLALTCLGITCTPEDGKKTDGDKGNGDQGGGDSAGVVEQVAEPVRSFPHDKGAFTQGLFWEEDIFYESTGQYGESRLRKVTADTGEVLKEIRLPDAIFGEGSTRFGDEIVVLSWKSNKGFVFKETDSGFVEQEDKAFTYEGQGWGLTHDGTLLILSDGQSPKLRFLNPVTKAVVKEVEVTLEGVPVFSLNELEYIRGKVYANIWQTNSIVVIDPETGRVEQKISVDLDKFFENPAGEGVHDPEKPGLARDNVLNGIAYDQKGERLFITGKRWPKIFEVKLVPR